MRHLTPVQNDPTSVIAPSADLVMWSRHGPSCDPDELVSALDTKRLVELHMMIPA